MDQTQMDSMFRPKTTPKDFFLEVALIITLYASVISIMTLLFQVIDIAFPDTVSGRMVYGYYNPYSGPVRMAIATLFVIFPVHLLISWIINKGFISNPEKKNLPIRKWLTYLTLFVAGGVIIGDLIALINTFLGGEITTRFAFKVLSIVVVLGFVFGYYLYDLKKDMPSAHRKIFAVAASCLILASIVFGFVYIGSPNKHRNLKFDAQKVSDLQNIQSNVLNYWQTKRSLPENLEALNNPLNWSEVPKDQQTGESYEYIKKGDLSFVICADFNLGTPVGYEPSYNTYYSKYDMAVTVPGAVSGGENWKHDAGRYCFERTIDPELYPKPQPLYQEAVY